jgi:hypothetical protein
MVSISQIVKETYVFNKSARLIKYVGIGNE